MAAQTANIGIIPICPQCGWPAEFFVRTDDDEDRSLSMEPLPVHCGACGWKGHSVRQIPAASLLTAALH